MTPEEIVHTTEFLAKWGTDIMAAKRRGSPEDRLLLDHLAIIGEPILPPPRLSKAPVDADRPHNRYARKLLAAMTKPSRGEATGVWKGRVGADCTINVRAAERFFKSELTGEPVVIFLTSEGGDPREAVAITEIMQQYAGVITVVVPSYAHSAALQIVAAGDRRECGPHARFMVHDVALLKRPRFTATELRTIAGDLDRLDCSLHASVAGACGVPLAYIQRLARAETVLRALPALQLGLVHKISSRRTDD